MTDPVRIDVVILPDRHELAVTMTVRVEAGGQPVRIGTPTWVPGDYMFVAYGRDLFDVTAVDVASGQVLTVRRDGWQGYVVTGGSREVAIRYLAYCSSWKLSEACGVLGDRTGVLTGARYFSVSGYRGPYRVTYRLPEGWAIHHPSGARQLADTTWEYPTYEILLDTPVCLGAFELMTRDVQGTPVHHVFLDRTVGSSQEAVEQFADQVDAICARFFEMFGSFPVSDYTFVYAFNPLANWGLEHLTSTMVGLDPNFFTNADQHAVGVRACAHEFFHAWNVRRLRPAPLDHLDLVGGSFSEGLWLAEGFTRYYEFLTCTRTGVYTPEQFLSSVVNYYRHLAVLPAYQRVSAVDSSLASYLNHDDPYPGRVNNSIDYYAKGMVMAFGVDATLRSETTDCTLDKAFVAFYQRYVGRGSGYTCEEVREFFDGVHAGLGSRLYREATEAGGLTLVEQLGRLGFHVEEETVPYLGLVLADNIGPGIYGVLDNSPAAHSGIAPEDVATAVDGLTFDLKSLKWAIAHQPRVNLTVKRGNEFRTYEITVGERTQIGQLRWAGDKAQAMRIASWLERDFLPAPGQDIPLGFYENFHGVETVI